MSSDALDELTALSEGLGLYESPAEGSATIHSAYELGGPAAAPGTGEVTGPASPKGCDTASHAPGETPVPALWFEIRPATAEELPAVFESWLGTYKRSQHAGCIPNHMYAAVTTACIEGLLARGARVSVLTARSAPYTVLGWVCWEADKRSTVPIVHYLFTRDGFRQRGYSSLLLKAIGVNDRFLYTHATGFAKYWPRARFNPGIARRKAL